MRDKRFAECEGLEIVTAAEEARTRTRKRSKRTKGQISRKEVILITIIIIQLLCLTMSFTALIRSL